MATGEVSHLMGRKRRIERKVICMFYRGPRNRHLRAMEEALEVVGT